LIRRISSMNHNWCHRCNLLYRATASWNQWAR